MREKNGCATVFNEAGGRIGVSITMADVTIVLYTETVSDAFKVAKVLNDNVVTSDSEAR